MFEVLVYLYENYWRPDACPDHDQLTRKLSAVGFETDEIQEALVWLDGLAENAQAYAADQADDSLRVYSTAEIDRLGEDSIGFVSFLESAGVLPPAMREMVIDRATAVGECPLALEDLKVIVLMVFWSLGEEPDALILDELFVAPEERLERRAILSGVGQSRVGRRLFRTDMDLTAEAALLAIADAGLTPDDIDGIASYPGAMGAAPPGFAGPGIVDVQDALGLSVNWHLAGPEGSAQIAPVIAACLAVAAGLCRHALVYRTVSEATAMARASAGGGRQGIGAGSHSVSGFASWLIPFGAMSAGNWLAMNCVRHMHEFGTKREHLGAIAVAGRKHAALNPNAVYRDPMTMDDYLTARMVSWPFGLFDCDAPCDGSTAVVVSSADCARDLPRPAVRVNSVGTAMRSRPSWDQWEDLTTMAARDAGAQLWSRTDLRPSDVDCAQLYDGFSFLALTWIESLGFCGKGEGGPFVEGGRIELGGALPMNTWGGQLSGGRLHGFGFLAEAIRQLRGECGERQVPDCEVVAVANGGGPVAGCMLLTR